MNPQILLHRSFSYLTLLLSLFITGVVASGCSSLPYPGDPEEKSGLSFDWQREGRIAFFDLPSSMQSEWDEDGRRFGFRRGKPIYTGLDAMALDGFALLKNRSFALLTNATGVDRELNRGIDLMLKNGVRPHLVFEPEHGMFGFQEGLSKKKIRIDPGTGLRIFSLYSSTKKPDQEILDGVEVIVVDLQNLPVRCYTYISTLTDLMDVAESLGIELMILDRPNPYGFWEPSGAMLDRRFKSFVGSAPVPFLYSMTLGEYANYMAHVRFRDLKLSIVRVAGYHRSDLDPIFHHSWINPSPNIPTFESAVVYPGVVFFEGTNVSLGRGTTRPFVYSGAPWMDEQRVLQELKRLDLPGVSFSSVVFQPTTSLYQGRVARGIQMIPHSREFDPLRTGYEYMRIIKKIHPDEFEIVRRGGSYFLDRLWGGDSYRRSIEADLSYDEFRELWIDDTRHFIQFSRQFLLYEK